MNIFKIEFKNQFKSIIVWSVTISLIFVLFIAFFPSMKDSAMKELVGAKLSAIPETLLKAFNIDKMPDFTDLMEYFAYCAQYINMAGCIYATMLGANSLIKEETDGTIEFLYSKPVSRTKIVTSKLLSNLATLIVFNIILFTVCAIGCAIVAPAGYEFITKIIIVIKSGFMIEVLFFSIGFVVSTLLSSSRQAAPTALGVFFVTYILGIFSGVVKKLNFLKYFSPFNYVIPSEVIKADYKMKTSYIILTISIIVLGTTFVYWKYNRKDMKI